MDLNKLYDILSETTTQLRKGDPVEHRTVGNVHVTEVYDMPHEDDVVDGFLEKVDCFFLTIGVRKKEAEARKAELMDILDTCPELADGLSYITVGAMIGDQGAAFSLFALGKVLGLWDIITPTTLHIEGEKARQLAGGGMIYMSGYRKEK